jgi:hypothetical protein
MTPEQQLDDVWREQLQLSGFGIDPACENDLKNKVRTAAQTIGGRGFVAQDVSDASANLVRLLETMMEISRGKGEKTLHEWSLRDALAKLCPLFPFC